MILQPIVENAIKHGVNAQRGVGRVDVSAVRENGSLVIEVRDSGPGFMPGTAHDGIGLANTRARLEQLYGSALSLRVRQRARRRRIGSHHHSLPRHAT